MFKRILICLVSTLMLSTGIMAVTSAPAQADRRPCVTRAEYNNVIVRHHRYAWTMAKVQDHFDTPGVLITQDGWGNEADVVRQYRKCRGWAADSGTPFVGIWFDNYSFWDWRFHAWAKNPNTAWRFPGWLY
jgi:hypothetical protein